MDSTGSQRPSIDPQQLRPIIKRLREIRAKHGSATTSRKDYVTVQHRLEQIISALDGWTDSDASSDAVDIRDVAARLVDLERFFSSSGYANVARVIREVEDSVVSLASGKPVVVAEDDLPPPQRFVPPTSTRVTPSEPEWTPRGPESEGPDEPVHWWLCALYLFYALCGSSIAFVLVGRHEALGRFSVATLAIVAGLISGAVVLIIHQWASGRLSTEGQGIIGLATFALVIVPWGIGGISSAWTAAVGHGTTALPPPREEALLVAEVTPTWVPTPTPYVPVPQTTVEDSLAEMLDRVASEIRETNIAMANHELDSAVEHLNLAAAADRHHRLVGETAAALVDALLTAADLRAENGEWDHAAALVDQARSVAMQFYGDVDKVNRTALRHSSMPRFVTAGPTERSKILAAVGRQVRVTLTNSDTFTGRLDTFKADTLSIDFESGVGGGQMRFMRDVPLNELRELRIYE